MAEIHGLKIPDLPEGALPLRCVALVECLMDDGKRVVRLAATDDLMTWEVAGMAAFLDEYCRNQMSGRS